MSEHSHTFFGLSHAPFSKEVPDSDLWLPPSKQSLVQDVLDTLQERHSVLLVGEPGVGKTCVLRALRQRLPKERFLQELASARAHPVFLLDEAHLLHADVLAHLHILLNYEWDSRALLSLGLVGLPGLKDRLSLSTHKSLLFRLHTRLRLEPVTADDSADYLRHRLQLAGGDREHPRTVARGQPGGSSRAGPPCFPLPA